MQELLRRVLRVWEKRAPLNPAQLKALGEEAYIRGWGLAGIWEQKFLERIQDSLIGAIQKGMTYSEWTQNEGQKILDGFGAGVSTYRGGKRWDPWYSELVMRNATQASFAGGRYSAMWAPEWQAIAPYWRYYATLDDRTRPEHAALHGKVFRKDDEAARHYLPPTAHNCRCVAIELTLAEVEDAGYQVTPGNQVPLLPTEGGGTVGRPPGGWDVDRVVANGSKTLTAAEPGRLRRMRDPEGPDLPDLDAVSELPASLEAAVRQVEAGIREISTHEVGALVGKDGVEIGRWIGMAREDHPDATFRLKLDGFPQNAARGSVFTHNHPTGRSFSMASGDLRLAVLADLEQIRAACPSATGGDLFIASRPATGWPTIAELNEASVRAAKIAGSDRSLIDKMLAAQHVDDAAIRDRLLAALDAEMSHLATEAACRILGIGYTRRPWQS